jgi:hypothetical protein
MEGKGWKGKDRIDGRKMKDGMKLILANGIYHSSIRKVVEKSK